MPLIIMKCLKSVCFRIHIQSDVWFTGLCINSYKKSFSAKHCLFCRQLTTWYNSVTGLYTDSYKTWCSIFKKDHVLPTTTFVSCGHFNALVININALSFIFDALQWMRSIFVVKQHTRSNRNLSIRTCIMKEYPVKWKYHLNLSDLHINKNLECAGRSIN